MPALFADDDNGKAERYAVAHYLASLGGPVAVNPKPPSKKDIADSVNRGQKLYMTIGCVACHGPEKTEKGGDKKESGPAFIAAAPAHFPLTGLGGKTTPEKLAEYLQNPTATDPSGRMPHMLLQGPEATDLARYLCQPDKDDVKPGLSDAPGKEKLSDAQADDLGKRLVVAKGCVNCHTIAPDGKPLAPSLTLTALEDLGKKKDAGCLADAADKRGKAPAFAFTDADRDALRAFLDDGLKGAGTPAPAYAARETIRQMNCIACHTKDGEGGLSTDVVEQLRKFENAENAEAVAPPTLTGVGHKLRTPWLKQVLLSAGRARPWMGLRMPQFGEPNVGRLPDALAALEGAAPDDDVYKTPLTAAKIEAGRTLIGKNAFGCISCHDLAGIANTGTRGPDLAGMNQRVRYEWYLRWLEQPQRMQPGTRMPQVFTDGKSLLATVLNGDATAQADAIWGYLSLGPGLPLPDGVGAPKGLVLTVKDKPYLLTDVHAGRRFAGRGGRLPRRRVGGVRRPHLPAGLRLVRAVLRRLAGLGRPRRQSGPRPRAAHLERPGRLSRRRHDLGRAARLRRAGQGPGLRRRPAGGQAVSGRAAGAFRRLHRKTRTARRRSATIYRRARTTGWT